MNTPILAFQSMRPYGKPTPDRDVRCPRAWSRACFGVLFVTVLSALNSARGEEAADRVDFARQILPVLSNKCFVCHGPDQHDETDLRLDSFEAASEDRGGYRAIDAKHPDESELLTRIHSIDDPMPPADAEKQLTEEERGLLDRWIAQGGEYAIHWALAPPQKSRQFDNVSEAIDSLVSARLAVQGIELAPESDRAQLARRVALVLTGLPPEPEVLAGFLNDESPQAYEHLVDELLASPAFGEHQARYWLDAVRYGDTHGLHLDNRRGIYPYRDWVVRAFNENLPLDQFVRWQLAGDLMPDPTLDQRVATGYVRMNPSTGEGGAIAEEFQMKNNFDRVETLGTVFLGLSLTCARCHTHKYDPIEQTDYYRLLAFFNNTAEPALDGNSYTYGPTVRVPSDQAAWERWRALESRASELIQLNSKGQPLNSKAGIEYAEKIAPWKIDGWRLGKPRPVQPSTDDQPNQQKPGEQKDADDSIAISGFPGELTKRRSKGRIPTEGQETEITADAKIPARMTLDVSIFGGPGTRLYLDESNVPAIELGQGDDAASGSIELWPGDHQLRFIITGRANLDSLRILVDSRWDKLAKSKRWESCSSSDQLRMLADPAGPFAQNTPPDSSDDWTLSALETAREMTRESARFTTSLVAEELPQGRETRLLRRGEYDLPVGDPLEPASIKVLGGWPETSPKNRLGLAEWLVSRDNPLVARVMINRIWQRVFGHGLVRTPEDFGLQGQQPTHPDLLDWLAVEMHDGGWNLKAMVRSMVLSKTFRQSSAWRTDIDDPENRLLARSLSYRLDAEVLRDLGLWASGLLDSRMGGEGVKPYQPAGMWAALAHPASNTKSYQQDHGASLYRRSLYVYWKRTSPHPMMTLFDAPDRESACVRRSRTNTPLQSLGMLNETQRIEMGRAWAGTLLRDIEDDPSRIHQMFQKLACRDAAESELAACLTLLEQLRSRYREAPEDAEQLLEFGEAGREESVDPAELAAWSQLATTVLASDIAAMLY